MSISRLLLCSVIAAVAMMLYAAAPRAGDDAAAIEKQLRQWAEHFNAGRAEKVCDLFAPDLVADYRGQPEKNYETLCTALRRDLTAGRRDYRYVLELNEVMVSGDLAVVRLIWHLTVTDKQTGATATSSDRGLDVFRRQPDGQWRISRFIGYEME